MRSAGENSARDVTRLLDRIRDGDEGARSRLIDLVYLELRRLAARCMLREQNAFTLQPTELVHEAYLKLMGQEGANLGNIKNRTHFFGAASTVMRQILVDYARAKHTQKRGGAGYRIDLDENLAFTEERSEEILALNESLKRLEAFDPRQSRIVELRFFGGLTDEEAAELLGISARTVKRDWRVAKAWLFADMNQ